MLYVLSEYFLLIWRRGLGTIKYCALLYLGSTLDHIYTASIQPPFAKFIPERIEGKRRKSEKPLDGWLLTAATRQDSTCTNLATRSIIGSTCALSAGWAPKVRYIRIACGIKKSRLKTECAYRHVGNSWNHGLFTIYILLVFV